MPPEVNAWKWHKWRLRKCAETGQTLDEFNKARAASAVRRRAKAKEAIQRCADEARARAKAQAITKGK